MARRPAPSKQDLDRLVASYPDTVAGHDGTFLTLKNGTRFRISDGRTDKTFTELLESPDIDDMFYARYPAIAATSAEPKQPDVNSDPGRVRFAPLFAAMYGDCNKNEVAKNLRAIPWLPKHGGGSVKVTTVNGVADALERVSRALDELPGDLIKFLRAGGRHLSLPHGRRLARHLNARLWRRHRHQHEARGLLALGGRSRRAALAQPHSRCDRAHLRDARLHLGRRLVSLRHHALRISAGAVAVGGDGVREHSLSSVMRRA